MGDAQEPCGHQSYWRRKRWRLSGKSGCLVHVGSDMQHGAEDTMTQTAGT